MGSLTDKLKSLGVKVGAQDLPPPRKSQGFSIEQVIDGKFVSTPYGESFVVESVYPPEHRHGRTGLQVYSQSRTIASWTNEPRWVELDSHSLIFLDTETSGLAGGTGTYAFLIGVGRLDPDGFRLAQYFMRDPIEEPAQLAALMGFLGPCAGLVTFNGKAFDVPILNARFITNGEVSPFNAAAHLDLLPLARRLWRDRLPSRALSYLEQHVLNVYRTEEDVPGWLVPQLYFDYLKSGDARPLKRVFYHNAMDVISMAALLNHVTLLLGDHPDGIVDDAIDLVAIAKLYEDLGELDTAAQLYDQSLSAELPELNRLEAIQRWSFMEKRRGNLEAASELWRQAAARKEVYACVELAKLFEHQYRDYLEALHWTEQAMNLVTDWSFSSLDYHRWLPELEHRMERLKRRLVEP